MAYSPNALQLTHVLQQLYRRLGAVVTKLTDGSDVLAIDTKLNELLGEGNVDDFVSNGTLIVIEDADGLGAAPEGEFTTITDYDSTANAFTLSPALTAPLVTGDKVLYIGADFPLHDMIEVVNDALKYIGEVPVPDTSLTTGTVTEYDLPAAIKGREILNVEIQSSTDTDDFQFVPVQGWNVVPAMPGLGTSLVTPYLTSGYLLRVTYRGIHPRVKDYDDYISEYFHPDLVHAAVFAHAIQWKNDSNAVQGSPDNAMLGLEQKAWSQYDRARLRFPVQLPPRRIQNMPHFWTPGFYER